ncbi:MAG: leucine-rich repeat domain-containing protein [Clostridia bacterium]|nr:leucine-rich repeat domain-containing protein [Clostridia bacterium]
MAVYHGSRFEVEGTVLKNYNRLDLPASEYSRSVLRNGVKGSSDNYLLGDLDVVIPDGITEIGEFAFFCNYEIKSVTLPSSVKKIAENAFWCCRYLKVINFGGGIVEIGAYAFEGCEELEEIHLPQSLKTIGRSAFDCCGFKEVLIPEGVEIIDCNPFCGCKNLESIEVEEGNENFCAKS